MDNIITPLTLNAIIQVYSILLSFLGVFYIFVIKKEIRDYEKLDEKVEDYIDSLSTYYSDVNFEEIKDKGISWLNNQIDEIKSVEIRQRIIFSEGYKELEKLLPRYLALEHKVGNRPILIFYGLFLFYSIVIILSIASLIILNLRIKWLSQGMYIATSILSLIGIPYLLGYLYNYIYRDKPI